MKKKNSWLSARVKKLKGENEMLKHLLVNQIEIEMLALDKLARIDTAKTETETESED